MDGPTTSERGVNSFDPHFPLEMVFQGYSPTLFAVPHHLQTLHHSIHLTPLPEQISVMTAPYAMILTCHSHTDIENQWQHSPNSQSSMGSVSMFTDLIFYLLHNL